VPGGTQELSGSRTAFAYGTSTFYGWLFNTIQLAIRFVTPICWSYNPDLASQIGLGFSAFARHY
jgi:hypothetical protein